MFLYFLAAGGQSRPQLTSRSQLTGEGDAYYGSFSRVTCTVSPRPATHSCWWLTPLPQPRCLCCDAVARALLQGVSPAGSACSPVRETMPPRAWCTRPDPTGPLCGDTPRTSPGKRPTRVAQVWRAAVVVQARVPRVACRVNGKFGCGRCNTGGRVRLKGLCCKHGVRRGLGGG